MLVFGVANCGLEMMSLARIQRLKNFETELTKFTEWITMYRNRSEGFPLSEGKSLNEKN